MKTHILGLLRKLINTTLVTSCVVSVILGMNQVAVARYQPPRDQKPPSSYTDSSGVRGGCKATDIRSLTLLAPVTHVGQTSSSYPTFAWFVPYNQQLPIEFSLYEFDNHDQPSKLVHKEQMQTIPGVMKLSLPSEEQGLKAGKRYLWQVETLCDRDRPSRNLLVRAEMEVVTMPSTLKIVLANTPENSQRANLYAQTSMWYDALSESLKFTHNRQIGKVAADLIKDLIRVETTQHNEDLYNIALSYTTLTMEDF